MRVLSVRDILALELPTSRRITPLLNLGVVQQRLDEAAFAASVVDV